MKRMMMFLTAAFVTGYAGAALAVTAHDIQATSKLELTKRNGNYWFSCTADYTPKTRSEVMISLDVPINNQPLAPQETLGGRLTEDPFNGGSTFTKNSQMEEIINRCSHMLGNITSTYADTVLTSRDGSQHLIRIGSNLSTNIIHYTDENGATSLIDLATGRAITKSASPNNDDPPPTDTVPVADLNVPGVYCLRDLETRETYSKGFSERIIANWRVRFHRMTHPNNDVLLKVKSLYITHQSSSETGMAPAPELEDGISICQTAGKEIGDESEDVEIFPNDLQMDSSGNCKHPNKLPLVGRGIGGGKCNYKWKYCHIQAEPVHCQ